MINGLEGIPGSGKSYEACVYHVLDALKKGRMVITNLPLDMDTLQAMDPGYVDLVQRRTRPMPILGTWDADRVDENGNGDAFQLFVETASEFTMPTGEKIGTARPKSPTKASATIFSGVWDYYSTWKHPTTGQGPLFVIDECHVAMPVQDTDAQVVEWFKLHRHFNADVLLMTQSFRDINQPIARLMAMLVKVRKADILGKKDHYIRKVHAGYRGAMISDEQRKYRPELFRLYKSHTQGNSVSESVASDVSPFIVKFNRFKWFFVVITALACAYAFTPKDDKKKLPTSTPQRTTAAPKPAQLAASAAQPAAPKTAASAAAETTATVDDPYPEPYGPKGLHITGHISAKGRGVYTVAVTDGMAVIGMVTSADLVKVGYTFEPLNDCAAVVAFGSRKRTIVCDAPQATLIPQMQATTPEKQTPNTPSAEPMTLRRM
nr:zonular occludens toxin domain-containing protein [uncultured Albidiferax sp.]